VRIDLDNQKVILRDLKSSVLTRFLGNATLLVEDDSLFGVRCLSLDFAMTWLR
jgi:hypothetical protein